MAARLDTTVYAPNWTYQSLEGLTAGGTGAGGGGGALMKLVITKKTLTEWAQCFEFWF
jgi:hypothetical protein